MANVTLHFNCDTEDGSYLETFLTDKNTILVSITNDLGSYTVVLDKSTAIKFAKTLRTEINKIQEEGSNE
tara:strand:- start:295 stop:504 length:210 start_codon:yes stop_codon:yes gene_type:complete